MSLLYSHTYDEQSQSTGINTVSISDEEIVKNVETMKQQQIELLKEKQQQNDIQQSEAEKLKNEFLKDEKKTPQKLYFHHF